MLPFGQYPVTWYTNGGTNIYFTANNFISGTSLTDIEISGSGAIDGQGLPWWPWAYTNNAVRPVMILLVRLQPRVDPECDAFKFPDVSHCHQRQRRQYHRSRGHDPGAFVRSQSAVAQHRCV